MQKRGLVLVATLVLGAGAVAFWLNGRQPDPEVSGLQATSPIDYDDPGACAPCHAAVVAEWRESMHSRAHESRDPIFAALRAVRIERGGEAVADECASCHYPRDARRTRPVVAEQGVSCASCHLVTAVDREKGAGHLALSWSEGVMAGPHDIAPRTAAVHGTGPAPDFMKAGSELCLACHHAAQNPQGVPTCTTGLEWAAAAEPPRCVECHMPNEEGPSGAVSQGRGTHRSHRFPGPHRSWYQDDPSFAAQGVGLTVAFEGDRANVILENRTSHGFPSGFPGRLATVQVQGLDAQGAVVWQDAKLTQLGKRYVNAEGETVPPPFGTRLAEDTRLKPGETRRLATPNLPLAVTRLDVALRFALLPPAMAEKLGIPKPESEPRTVATATVTR